MIQRYKTYILALSVISVLLIPFLLFAQDTEDTPCYCVIKHDFSFGWLEEPLHKGDCVADVNAECLEAMNADSDCVGAKLQDGWWGTLCMVDYIQTIQNIVFTVCLIFAGLCFLFALVLWRKARNKPGKKQRIIMIALLVVGILALIIGVVFLVSHMIVVPRGPFLQ